MLGDVALATHVMPRRCWATFLAFVLCCSADDEVDCKAMRVKQLRTFLHQRGVKCEGCAEKADFLHTAATRTTDPTHDRWLPRLRNRLAMRRALCEEHKDTLRRVPMDSERGLPTTSRPGNRQV